MEQYVKSILDPLLAVGFPKALEWAVQVHLCFEPLRFSVQHEQFKGSDQLRYQIWIVREEGSGGYLPAYYDATLVRPLDLKPHDEAAEQAIALNQQMQLVNWHGLLEKASTATVGDLTDLKMVAEIVSALQHLRMSENGAYYADLLSGRYWTRTPFEPYAVVNNQLRFLIAQMARKKTCTGKRKHGKTDNCKWRRIKRRERW